MDLILSEFQRDLEVVVLQLDLMDGIKSLSAVSELPEKYQPATKIEAGKSERSLQLRSYLSNADALHKSARNSHTGLPIASGTMALYIAGRFEEYTRTSFEDLCQKLTQQASTFKSLPKKMQESLVVYTAMVMQSPRKYQHGDGAVAGFAANLAANLSAESSSDKINYQCLSITEANMKPDVLAELYERVGAKEIWKKISQQAPIQAYFATSDASNAESLSRQKLVALMDLRNSIAHPSTSITWPATESVRDFVSFLSVLAGALSSLSEVFAATLCRKEE